MTYENVKTKEGTLYIKSKEQKEGYETIQYTDKKTKENKTTYHKKISIKGEFRKVSIVEDRFAGEVLQLNFLNKEEDTTYSLALPLFMKSSTLRKTDDYFNSVVKVLGNMKIGEEYTLFVNNKNKNPKNERLYKNVVILDSSNKMVRFTFEMSEIPKWTSRIEEDERGNEEKIWNCKEANIFFIKKCEEAIEKLNVNSPESDSFPGNPPFPLSDVPNTKESPVKEKDDLPF